MTEMNILLNVFWNFISSEIILRTYFAIQVFEHHWGLS